MELNKSRGGGGEYFATEADRHSLLTVNVDALRRRVVDVLLGEARDEVLADDGVERPPLVRARHLLPHGRQEALRVEEPRHPEHLQERDARALTVSLTNY